VFGDFLCVKSMIDDRKPFRSSLCRRVSVQRLFAFNKKQKKSHRTFLFISRSADIKGFLSLPLRLTF
jgi:hypothetical protein